MNARYRLFVCLLGLSAAASAAEPALNTDKEKVSYVVGYQIGSQLKQQGMDIDIQALGLAIQDVMGNVDPRLTTEQAQEVMMKYQQEQLAARQQQAEKNAETGKAFLAANKDKPGVTTVENGLQYKVIKAGSGKKPAETDTVTVHYRGTLIDGTEFDSSYKRGEPATFQLNQVIPGWTQALQLMEEGAQWQVFIPAELGYGERAPSPDIGPNSTLIFDIELIKVN